ncbi:MAG: T9SS type A sorting domain-containing protein, partial [Candidatus Cloacimonetes bacterium]|nr:T9SS type A sorting domain-containing protein [Candidatus Cloacimonadota bacterium]
KVYIPQDEPKHLKLTSQTRNDNNYDVPNWEFIQAPTTLTGFTNYYDYMPGSYCGRPLVCQPDIFGGVYFLFHGRPNTTDNRRVYWAYVYPNGAIEYATITTSDTWQGYPGITMHPASGDPIGTWHDILGSSTPEDTNTLLSYDDYALLHIPGFWKTPVRFDQPIPYVDEYIWPYTFIGMAPDYATSGNYRVYQTSQQNPDGEIEHDIIRWIDVPQDDWVYGDLTIMLDKNNWGGPVNISRDWSNPDLGIACRPYPSFAVDPYNAGHVAIFGYAGYTNGLIGGEIVPQGWYVWDCYDGGETWSYDNLHFYETDVGMLNEYVVYAVENIPGFTVDDVLIDSLHVWIGWPGNQHSTHRTTLFDCEGNMHLPELFWICSVDGVAGSASYWPYYEFQYQGEVVYKTDGTWEIRNVPNLPGWDAWSGMSVPWKIDPISGDTLVYPWRDYPFAISNDVGFHENSQRNAACLTQPWMVQVWNSGTKTLYAENGIPGYDDYATHPILHVSATINNGENWSAPIELSDIYSSVYPEFGNMITMYPYINATIKDLGGGWGRIDMYFFDDNDYGSSINSMGPATGGEMVYCSFKIDFDGLVLSTDPQPQPEVNMTLYNIPNPFFSHTQIQFSASAGVENAKVTIYNVRGQLVKTLDTVTDTHTEGHATWDGKDNSGKSVSNGIYFYKVKTDNIERTQKLILMR